ncbi:MAG: hypothetical protein LQ350_001858 [Teloschistes chrysophthalmus]|nr:MAG: hypothetical protein LQ350_001858 [Niorma chrysophthalma]
MGYFEASLLAVLCAPNLIWASGILQPRDQTIHTCNVDNCLRQVRSNYRQADPFCTSYLKNGNPAVEPVTASDYVTRKLTPYTPPGQKKRALTAAPVSTPAPVLELRQANLPSFASKCTGDPNRLSSACTCEIGYTAQQSTTTVVRNAPGVYRTVGVCGGSPVDYDYYPRNQGGFEYNNQDKFGATFNLDPSGSGCQLNLLTSSTDQQVDATCPAGLAEIYDPEVGNFNNTYGIGLCGYLLRSDE